MPRQLSITPEQLLADYPPPVQRLAEQLRQLVKDLVPAAVERAYPVWRGIGYRHPEAGYFGAIFLHSDRVKLGLEQGARLPDPDGILKPGPTAGKQVRYLEITNRQDIDPEQIAQLLTAAIDLQRSLRGKWQGKHTPPVNRRPLL